uniref:Ulp1 protease family, C-terminal catalytic domain-containing protein n=1 Tax=Rhabditophanes sp. KR3021 TaxID=114890 RepID=A0AC35TXS4_9BILA
MLGVSLKNTQQYGVIEKINLHNSFLLQNWHYVGANNWKYIETGFVRLPDIKAILMAYYIPLDEMERINVIGFVLDGNCIPNEPTTHILAFNQGSRRTTTYRQDVRVVKKLQDVEAIETKKLNDTRNRSIMYWFGNGGIPGSFFTHVDKSKIINFVEKSVSKGSKIGNETKTKKFCKFNNGTPVKVSDASSTSRNHRKVKLRSANKRSIPTKSSIMNNTVSIGSKMTTPAVKLDAGEVVVEEKVADGRKPTEGNNNKGGVDRNVSYKGAKNEERNNKKADRNDSRKGKSGAIEVGKNEHLVSKTNNRKKASNKTYFAVPTTPSTPITIAPTLPPRPPSSSKKEPLFVNTSLLKKDILIWVNLSTKLNQTI